MSGYWQDGRRQPTDEQALADFDLWALERARDWVARSRRRDRERQCGARVATCDMGKRKARCV